MRTGDIPSSHPLSIGEQTVIALVVAPIALILSLAALPIVAMYLVAKLIDAGLAMLRSRTNEAPPRSTRRPAEGRPGVPAAREG